MTSTTTAIATSFSFANDQYTLTVSADKALVTSNWLTAQGCDFDRYISQDTCKIVFLFIPQSVVDAIAAKHPLQQPEADITEVVLLAGNRWANERKFVYLDCEVAQRLFAEYVPQGSLTAPKRVGFIYNRRFAFDYPLFANGIDKVLVMVDVIDARNDVCAITGKTLTGMCVSVSCAM